MIKWQRYSYTGKGAKVTVTPLTRLQKRLANLVSRSSSSFESSSEASNAALSIQIRQHGNREGRKLFNKEVEKRKEEMNLRNAKVKAEKEAKELKRQLKNENRKLKLATKKDTSDLEALNAFGFSALNTALQSAILKHLDALPR